MELLIKRNTSTESMKSWKAAIGSQVASKIRTDKEVNLHLPFIT